MSWKNNRAVSNKEFLDIQATVECRFTLKRIRDMVITYSQMYRTVKFSQHSSTMWPVYLNGWVFVYEPSGHEFESRYCHFNFRWYLERYLQRLRRYIKKTRRYIRFNDVIGSKKLSDSRLLKTSVNINIEAKNKVQNWY